jgi:ABC-type sugar transport system permease subunit
MVLYLAGLKAVDPSLREAALMDGANSWQTFWRVVFPTMRPINIVVLVVTVIESLRAFDLVYITSNGNPLRGLELLSVAVTQNIVGETQRIGFGSTLGVVLLVISLVPISIFLYQAFRREEQR